MRRTTLVLLATVASIGLVSGCSDSNTGRPTPETGGQSGSSGTATSPSSSFEGVELDTSKFSGKPCEALTSAQLSTLGTFKTPEPGKSALGPSCDFRAQKVIEGVTYEVVIASSGNTLESIIEGLRSSKTPVVEETKVAGYAAVNSDQTNAKGACATAVGTSSKDAISVQLITENKALPEYNDPCGQTEKVAALVIQNLKG
ncbi:DUF3558 domain-containing protein [Umezawaea endophytica]|uniref:DUF3558 domain-containing protein n=1 Tax=Umezawaea endophytica TaxID=1654476 RepID=A0A9X3AK93_9PSEU|nr:DUF3558 domain-containing protein [Umezawaea endophytica]MCS7482565.1 DUF3558 domain-containing protein [Umezawaea endophytica]